MTRLRPTPGFTADVANADACAVVTYLHASGAAASEGAAVAAAGGVAVTAVDGVAPALLDPAFGDEDPPQPATAVATLAATMHILNMYDFISDLP